MSVKKKEKAGKSFSLQQKILLSIFVFVFLIYGNGIRNGYCMDDRYVTVTNPVDPDNPRVAKGIQGIPEIFSTHYVETETQKFDYRPLPMATFAVEYQFFGSNPQLSHFFNVLIYACTCMFLFLVLCRMLKGYSLVLPALITFLFAAHPVHTEVVDNLKSRDELLGFFLGIISLFYFFRYVDDEQKRFVPLVKMLLFLLLALFCKRTALLFSGLVFLSAIFFTRFNLKQFVSLGLVLTLPFLLYLLAQKVLLPAGEELREFTFYENPLYFQKGFSSRVEAALFTTGYYARLLLFPYPLSFYYGYEAVPMAGFFSPWLWVSVLVHGAVIVYVVRTFRKKEVISFGLLIYLVGLLPFANFLFPMVGILGERFIYFSSFGFCVVAACLLIRLTRLEMEAGKNISWRMNPPLKRISLSVLLLFSVLVVARNEKWKDLLTISLNDVKHFDDSYMLHSFVANNLYAQSLQMPGGPAKQSVMAESKKHFSKAARILEKGVKEHEKDLLSQATLAGLYSKHEGRADEAIVILERVLKEDPGNESARFDLIYCYQLKNMPDTAIVMYERMIKNGTKYAMVYQALHDLYLAKSEYKKALAADKRWLEASGASVKAYLNLGNDFILMQDTSSGLDHFEKAAALSPSDPFLLSRVAEVFKMAGRYDKAGEYAQKAQKARKK